MERSSYREHDRVFGQSMLTLRTVIGLTQAGLADILGVSRHAVGGWEAGQTYPKSAHLKRLIALGMQQGAFAPGHEAAEIRALWQAARQKVLLDERWLQELLNHHTSPLMPTSPEQMRAVEATSVRDVKRESRVDWSDALDVPSLYGRAGDLALLARWVTVERCRVVSVLGMGGIGKSALAVTMMREVATQFEVVIWRSLRDAPACEALLETCLQVLAPQSLPTTPATLEGRLQLLIAQLRDRRVLLVLDNLEMLLEDTGTGHMRAGAEGYAWLLRRIGETAHQSCLVLTSREKPTELVPLEGSSSAVRAVRLAGLDASAGTRLLAERDVAGTALDRERLVEAYGGNPLALKIVAQTIVEVFGGEIVPFLAQGEVVFGGIRELLREQFDRLSALDRTVVYWLAILREPAILEELLAALSTAGAHMPLLEALDGLRRRSLIEHGQRAGSFTLQSVVLEYTTARLISEAISEIAHGTLAHLIAYALCQAQAKDYVRKTQEQLLVLPTLTRLRSMYQGQADIEARLLALLDQLRGYDQATQGYGPANLVTLLRVLRGSLRGLDLSRLALRGVPLQGVDMQDTRLAGAVFQDTTFTEAFDAINAVATSRVGHLWAAASRRGEVRVWRSAGQTLHRVWPAHTERVSGLAFSPDGRTLVSGSWDNTVKLWDVATSELLWTGWHTGGINTVAFAPDGQLIASAGNDTLVQLWDAQSGTNVQTLAGQGGVVYSLAWSLDGRLLASGCANGSIWVWAPQQAPPEIHVQTLAGHTHWVTGVAFAPNGAQLASTSFDCTVKLWNLASAACFQTFSEHAERVLRVAWSLDGRTIASAGFDKAIWLWDATAGRSRAVLRGHTAVIYSLAFTSDSRSLLSGSDDGTIRVWNVDSGQSLRIIGGYVAALLDVDWSPDGTQLATGSADTLVMIWNEAGATPPKALRGHGWIVQGVAWHPDGHLLASGGYDSIGLWDTATGTRVQMLRDPDPVDTIFQGIAWSPDGRLLACGSYLRGVQVWDIPARAPRWIGLMQPTRIRRVAWSPDGTRLVGGGDDGYVQVWDASDGTMLLQLAGHSGAVMSVAWSPDGTRLASGGGGRGGGELFVWDAQSGARVQTLAEHAGLIATVTWSPRGELLITGGSDGALSWWEVQSRQCLLTRQGHQGVVQALKLSPDGLRLASCGDDGVIVLWDIRSGEQTHTLRRDRPYERLDITGIQGLSEAQKASLRTLGAFEKPFYT